MYEVITYFESEADLKHFLETTRKFSKRFYHVKKVKLYAERAGFDTILRVTAIAISRDLTQIFKMEMNCDSKMIPIDPEIKKIYCPLISAEGYCDVFAHNGFQKTDMIRRDGVEMVRY